MNPEPKEIPQSATGFIKWLWMEFDRSPDKGAVGCCRAVVDPWTPDNVVPTSVLTTRLQAISSGRGVVIFPEELRNRS